MPKSKQNLAREILTVALLLAAVAASEYWFFQLWRLDWSVPMLYGGDGIYWVGQVQRATASCPAPWAGRSMRSRANMIRTTT